MSKDYWQVDEQGVGSELLAAHLPCLSCGSSDALSAYTDHTFCFSCRKTNKIKGELYMAQVGEDIAQPQEAAQSLEIKSKGMYGPIEDRGISKEVAKFYGVEQIKQGDTVTKHIYPYYRDGIKVAQKIRDVATKQFFIEGFLSGCGLFGQQLFPASKKPYVIVCEGELDALAAYQMTGGIYPCLSIPTGIQSAIRPLKDNMEYLTTFQCIVLCFDGDERGREMSVKAARLFPPKKCKIFTVNPAYKDACDYLKAGKAREFTETLYNSPAYSPAGILDIYDLHDRFLERKKKLALSNLTYPWAALNDMTYGIRTNEFVIVTAETGIGKTSFLREVQQHLINTSAVKIGVMYIEEPVEDTYGLTLGLEVSKAIHLPTVIIDEAELQVARDKIGKERLYIYEHFGSNEFSEVLERIRYMVKGLGCEVVILDHISMLVSDQRYDDERKALDAISTKLKQLTVELGVAILAVAHKNREGKIRGSAMIEKMANLVIDLDRDAIADDPVVRNQLKVIVVKNRFSGQTGPACLLNYNASTNHLVEHNFEVQSVA